MAKNIPAGLEEIPEGLEEIPVSASGRTPEQLPLAARIPIAAAGGAAEAGAPFFESLIAGPRAALTTGFNPPTAGGAKSLSPADLWETYQRNYQRELEGMRQTRQEMVAQQPITAEIAKELAPGLVKTTTAPAQAVLGAVSDPENPLRGAFSALAGGALFENIAGPVVRGAKKLYSLGGKRTTKIEGPKIGAILKEADASGTGNTSRRELADTIREDVVAEMARKSPGASRSYPRRVAREIENPPADARLEPRYYRRSDAPEEIYFKGSDTPEEAVARAEDFVDNLPQKAAEPRAPAGSKDVTAAGSKGRQKRASELVALENDIRNTGNRSGNTLKTEAPQRYREVRTKRGKVGGDKVYKEAIPEGSFDEVEAAYKQAEAAHKANPSASSYNKLKKAERDFENYGDEHPANSSQSAPPRVGKTQKTGKKTAKDLDDRQTEAILSAHATDPFDPNVLAKQGYVPSDAPDLTPSELATLKRSIQNEVNFGSESQRASQVMKENLARVFREAEDSAVARGAPGRSAEFQKIKEVFGPAAMSEDWAHHHWTKPPQTSDFASLGATRWGPSAATAAAHYTGRAMQSTAKQAAARAAGLSAAMSPEMVELLLSLGVDPEKP